MLSMKDLRVILSLTEQQAPVQVVCEDNSPHLWVYAVGVYRDGPLLCLQDDEAAVVEMPLLPRHVYGLLAPFALTAPVWLLAPGAVEPVAPRRWTRLHPSPGSDGLACVLVLPAARPL